MSQTINDRYEIQDMIGLGGMGEVYRALDSQTQTTVAIKALKPEIVASEPELVERFVREGQALRKLNHPNIVKMLDTLEVGDQYYIVMEYVKGGSLREVLQQGQLPVDQVLAISLEIADALTRAHHLKIIHRDIKPANILLADDGSPRLTDFGVAHMDDKPSMTQTGAMVGTFAYLSPEACRADALDERTDIWSFGVLIYEMLAGKNPFNKPQASATISTILTDNPPDVTTVREDVSASLADLINRMLKKNRDERISSVRMVGAELESIIRGLNTPLRSSVQQAAPVPQVDEKSRFATPTPTLSQSSEAVYQEPSALMTLEDLQAEIQRLNTQIKQTQSIHGEIVDDELISHHDKLNEQLIELRRNQFLAHPENVKTNVDLGFIKVLEGKDGSTFVKLGPLQILTDGDENTDVRIGASKVIDRIRAKQQRKDQRKNRATGGIEISPKGILLLLLLLLLPGALCIGGLVLLISII